MSDQQPNRQTRRARAAASRKPKPGRTADLVTKDQFNEALHSLTESLNKAVQQLSTNQERLGNLLNNNQAAYIRAFSMTDGHLLVLRAILTDMYRGTARPKPLHPDDIAWLETVPSEQELERHVWLRVEGAIIDYEWYYEQYNAKLKAAEIQTQAEAAAVAAQEAAKAASPEPEEKEEADEEFVFGGDYGKGADATPSPIVG